MDINSIEFIGHQHAKEINEMGEKSAIKFVY